MKINIIPIIMNDSLLVLDALEGSVVSSSPVKIDFMDYVGYFFCGVLIFIVFLLALYFIIFLVKSIIREIKY